MAYDENLEELSEDKLRLLHNLDLDSQAPYGNDILSAARELWDDHIQQTSRTIPICMVTEAVSPRNIGGGRPQARIGRSLSFSCKTASQNLYHRNSGSTPQRQGDICERSRDDSNEPEEGNSIFG
jgi:hypothetical protein